jgi:hypothetical protein
MPNGQTDLYAATVATIVSAMGGLRFRIGAPDVKKMNLQLHIPFSIIAGWIFQKLSK